ncbi:MAG: GntR family transcriptional regulator [Gemmatimonadetes bacterium]|nr:GntR family transcriptional regulator [Gemmatimonadota bacterium]
MLKRFPEYGRLPGAPSVVDKLRFEILGRIHTGVVQPGDRLESIRELANRNRVDHRAAARAYRQLESEGLVEVRAKSGVFVSRSVGWAADGEQGRSWAAEILWDAWEKGIPRASLCSLFGGVLSAPLRCGCIESNEDHMVALTGEIGRILSLEVIPILVDTAANEETPPAPEIADVDMLVTTVFHARHARAVAAAAGKPLAILNVNPEFAAAIAKRLAGGPITAVIADERYSARASDFFSAVGYRLAPRFVLAAEARRLRVDFQDDRVLVTRAARRRLGLEEFHLVPLKRMMSDESARALCEIVAAAAPRQAARPHENAPQVQPLAPAAASAVFAEPLDDFRPVERPVEEIAEEVQLALEQQGMFAALRVLNGTTPHRFTGLYRFEPDWVRSVVLYDRQNPHLQVGADVPIHESYCVLTAEAGDEFCVGNALGDARLQGHKAQGAVLCYCAVHLKDAAGASWGTICHYDFRPSQIHPNTTAVLKAVQPLFEAVLGPAVPYVRTLPDSARARPRVPIDTMRRSTEEARRAPKPPPRTHPSPFTSGASAGM